MREWNGADEVDRVVGGTVHTGDPAAVYIITHHLGQGGKSGDCTGTLVLNQRTVMTAAHCLPPSGQSAKFVVYSGTKYTFAGPDTPPAISDPGFVFSTETDAYRVHEGHREDDQGITDDIGIIYLREDMKNVAPAAIAPRPLSANDVGKSLRTVGWGVTSAQGNDAGVKRTAPLRLRKVHGVGNKTLQIGEAGGPGNCFGDSGGPTFMTMDGQEVVVAVTSWGPEACDGESHGMNVGAYADWITAAANNQPATPGTTPTPGSDSGSDSICCYSCCSGEGHCPPGGYCPPSGYCPGDYYEPSGCDWYNGWCQWDDHWDDYWDDYWD